MVIPAVTGKMVSLRKEMGVKFSVYSTQCEAATPLLTVNSNKVEDEMGLDHYDFPTSLMVPGKW